MKPTVSRIVIALNHGLCSGDAPAIVTRVWGDIDPAEGQPACVNLQVLPDCAPPACKTSVPMFNDRLAAERWLANLVGRTPICCFWPDRVPDVQREGALKTGAHLAAAA